jgi:RNA polymerase sigma factor (sigma-70 family)
MSGLFEKIRAKNAAAVEATVAKWHGEYGRSLRNFLCSRSREEDADDLYQEVMQKVSVALMKKTAPLNPENPKALLFKIARNHLIDYYRKRQRRGGEHFSLDQNQPESSGHDSGLDSSSLAEDIDLVSYFLQGLSEKQRQLIDKRFFHGYSLKELADENYKGKSRINGEQKIWMKIDRVLLKMRKKIPHMSQSSRIFGKSINEKPAEENE